MPRRFPETTIDREKALLDAGASSPTRGSMICGVTVVTAVIYEMVRKALKLFVTHRPILVVLERKPGIQGGGHTT